MNKIKTNLKCIGVRFIRTQSQQERRSLKDIGQGVKVLQSKTFPSIYTTDDVNPDAISLYKYVHKKKRIFEQCDLHFASPEHLKFKLPTARRPEIAVIGRSNVGKSSLIEALSGKRGVARVSKTPGCTK